MPASRGELCVFLGDTRGAFSFLILLTISFSDSQ